MHSTSFNPADTVSDFVITKGNLLDVWQKVQNGEKVKACLRCGYHYGTDCFRELYDIDHINSYGNSDEENSTNGEWEVYHGNVATEPQSLRLFATVDDGVNVTFTAEYEDITNNTLSAVNIDRYDLVLKYEAPANSYLVEEEIFDRLSVKSMNFNKLVQKLNTRQNARVRIECVAYYGDAKYVGGQTPVTTYYSPSGNNIHVHFIIGSNGAWSYGTAMMGVVIGSDGTITGCDLSTLT